MGKAAAPPPYITGAWIFGNNATLEAAVSAQSLLQAATLDVCTAGSSASSGT